MNQPVIWKMKWWTFVNCNRENENRCTRSNFPDEKKRFFKLETNSMNFLLFQSVRISDRDKWDQTTSLAQAKESQSDFNLPPTHAKKRFTNFLSPKCVFPCNRISLLLSNTVYGIIIRNDALRAAINSVRSYRTFLARFFQSAKNWLRNLGWKW